MMPHAEINERLIYHGAHEEGVLLVSYSLSEPGA